MVGTALTVLVAFYDLGALNNVVMLTIAIVKATFVVLYFMHVRWGTRLTWVVVGVGVLLATDHVHVHDDRLPDPRLAARHAAVTPSA